MAAMLHEIGIDSYYVVINAERGSVTPDMPANDGFNHVILAIKLPAGLSDDRWLQPCNIRNWENSYFSIQPTN